MYHSVLFIVLYFKYLEDRHRWNGNIKINIAIIGVHALDSSVSEQDSIMNEWAPVKMVMNLHFS
jgi:hypothetical protein